MRFGRHKQRIDSRHQLVENGDARIRSDGSLAKRGMADEDGPHADAFGADDVARKIVAYVHRVFGGNTKSRNLFSGNSENRPRSPASNTPFSPTYIEPSTGICAFRLISGGRGGRKPPSYQCTRSGGKPSRSGKSHVTMLE